MNRNTNWLIVTLISTLATIQWFILQPLAAAGVEINRPAALESVDSELELDEGAEEGTEEPGEESNSSLRPESAVYNWGTLFRGEEIGHTFTLINQGDRPIRILEVKPACGCTLVQESLAGSTVDPGAKVRIPLRLDTSAFRGGLKKYTEVLTDDARVGIKLWMRGEVVDLVKLDPEQPVVDVVCGSTERPEPFALQILPQAKGQARVQRVKARHGLLHVEQQQLETDSLELARLRLSVNASDEKTPGIETEILECDITLDGRKHRIRLPVTVKLRPRIALTPLKSAYFRRKETAELKKNPEAHVEKTLELQSIGGAGHKFRIVSVAELKAPFAVRLLEAEAGKRYALTITVARPAGQNVRFAKAVVEIKTDDPLVPLIKVPVRAQF